MKPEEAFLLHLSEDEWCSVKLCSNQSSEICFQTIQNLPSAHFRWLVWIMLQIIVNLYYLKKSPTVAKRPLHTQNFRRRLTLHPTQKEKTVNRFGDFEGRAAGHCFLTRFTSFLVPQRWSMKWPVWTSHLWGKLVLSHLSALWDSGLTSQPAYSNCPVSQPCTRKCWVEVRAKGQRTLLYWERLIYSIHSEPVSCVN